MHIANLSGRAVTFVAGEPVDIAQASGIFPGDDPQQLWQHWPDVAAWGRSVGAVGPGHIDPQQLAAPVPRPLQVFGVGLNYAEHAAEAARATSAAPAVFAKFSSCIVGPEHIVRLASEQTDWEVELVAVIGRRADHVRPGEGWTHVAGLTIGQDLSDRPLQVGGTPPQPSLGKSRPGYGPIGPWVVDLAAFPDPTDLDITCELDGERVQSGRTRDQIRPVGSLIEWLSSHCVLLPGDLVFTGTPAGVGHVRTPPRYVRSGQSLQSTISGIGTLTTRFA
jgi:2,4-diketo-3-deoxy-L-fuconate hydrolase